MRTDEGTYHAGGEVPVERVETRPEFGARGSLRDRRFRELKANPPRPKKKGGKKKGKSRR